MSNNPKPNLLDLNSIATYVGERNATITNPVEDPYSKASIEFIQSDMGAHVLTTFSSVELELMLVVASNRNVPSILSSILAFGFQVGREYGRREMSKEIEEMMGVEI